MTAHLTTDVLEGIVTLTLSRPDKKNALTEAMYGALADAIEQAENDASVRAIVIRAEGDMFCAGNDMQDFLAPSTGGQATVGDRRVGRFIRALAASTVPIIAAVQGKAVGVGTTMLLHCDSVILADDAQLITPFVELGLVPEAGSTALLPQRIGHARAFSMFVLGEPLNAHDAVAYGVASEVVSRAELHSRAQAVASAVAAKPAEAVRATKRLMRDTDALLDRIDAELVVFEQRLACEDTQAIVGAFMNKRAAPRPDAN